VVLRSDISASHVKETQESCKKIVEEKGGAVVYMEHCGLLSLAYPIKHYKKAHYLLFDIEAAPDGLDELEHKVRISSEVLRFLRFRVKVFGKRPSVLAHARGKFDPLKTAEL